MMDEINSGFRFEFKVSEDGSLESLESNSEDISGKYLFLSSEYVCVCLEYINNTKYLIIWGFIEKRNQYYSLVSIYQLAMVFSQQRFLL